MVCSIYEKFVYFVSIFVKNFALIQNCILGHVNGAQYNVLGVNKSFIHARLAVGPYVNGPKAELLIPRIKFHPEDRKLPFEFQRLQFPVRLGFAITSNQ